MYWKAVICGLFLFILQQTIVSLCDPSPNPHPLPKDTENFDTGKSYKKMDLNQINKMCNESFKVQPEWLQELNETGSFPDEADKIPMCFLKCFLENIGIWSKNGTIDKERAVQLMWADTTDDIEECLPEMIGNTDCEKAYYLTRCITTRALVDGRGHGVNKR